MLGCMKVYESSCTLTVTVGTGRMIKACLQPAERTVNVIVYGEKPTQVAVLKDGEPSSVTQRLILRHSMRSTKQDSFTQ